MHKIGAHVTIGPRDGYGEFCEAGPAVVIAVDQGGALVEAKQKSGQTVTIFRDTTVYLEAPEGFNQAQDMAALAREWYPLLKAKWLQNPADFYTLTNEQGGDDPAVMQRLVAYEREMTRLANQDGFKTCILNLATGTPGNILLWKSEYAAWILEAGAAGNIYGRHVYGSGDWVGPDGDVLPGNPQRPIQEAIYLASLGYQGKIALTECGLDAGYGYAGDDRFVAQVVAYDTHLRQHSVILGMCLWTLGNWEGANWQSAIPEIIPHMTDDDPPPPDPTPPPYPTAQAFLWQESQAYAGLYGIQYVQQLGLWKLIKEDGLYPVHREINRTYQGRMYAIQGAIDLATGQNWVYVWSDGLPIEKYSGPGTTPPVPYVERPEGVDVSRYQNEMDWERTAQKGGYYAFMKATQRLTYVDPTFLTNWRRAKEAGLLVGAYHYFQPNYDARGQAEHFVNTVKGTGQPADLPYVLDVEEQGTHPDFANLVRICLQRIGELTGRKPILYANPYYLKTYLAAIPKSDYDLWIASWTTQSEPLLPAGWTNWVFWQYTSKANGPDWGAESARIDVNRFNGLLTGLYLYAGTATPPAPLPPPSGDLIDLRQFKPAHPDCWRVVRNPQGQQEDVQDMQLGNGLFVRRKNSLGEWHRYDNTYFYLVHDTSPAPGSEGVERVYTLYKDGAAGAPKSAIQQVVGEKWFEIGLHHVQFRAKDNCRDLAENSGSAQNSSKIVRYERNYTFNGYGQNLTFDEVIWEQTGQETQIYGRKDGKSCGWIGWAAPWGSSEPVEIHWDRGRLTEEPDRFCNW